MSTDDQTINVQLAGSEWLPAYELARMIQPNTTAVKQTLNLLSTLQIAFDLIAELEPVIQYC